MKRIINGKINVKFKINFICYLKVKEENRIKTIKTIRNAFLQINSKISPFFHQNVIYILN